MCWLHTPRCGPSMKVQPGATPFKALSPLPPEAINSQWPLSEGGDTRALLSFPECRLA